MIRLAGWMLVVLALATAGSCSDSSGPVAGTLTVSLATPNPGSDGAILVTLTGPEALTSITPEPGLRVFTQALGTVSHLAVTGTLANGAVLTVGVAHLSKAAQYAATVQSVAAADFQLRPLSGYSLTISR